MSDFITTEREWDVDKLSHILPEDKAREIRALVIPSIERAIDVLSWPGSTSGTFSVRSAYHLIAGGDFDDEDMNWIWRIPCLEKVKSIIWLAVKEKLLTNIERVKCNLAIDGTCLVYGDEEETIDHLFRRCGFVSDC